MIIISEKYIVSLLLLLWNALQRLEIVLFFLLEQ